MSIPVSVTSSGSAANSAGNTAASTGASNVKTQDAAAAEGTPAQKARMQLNASIVQASLNVSISSQNDPLALVYKSALTGINEALQSQYGDDAIQNAMSQDNTPEGTAGRIVALSTGFFEAYKNQHPGQDDDVALGKFMDTIRGGFERGFKEASNILSGLNVLSGDIASNIDKTYALVQKGYDDFVAAQTSKQKDSATSA